MPTSAVLKNDFNDNHQNEPKKDRRVISKNVFFEVAEISNESYLQLHIAEPTQYKAAGKILRQQIFKIGLEKLFLFYFVV